MKKLPIVLILGIVLLSGCIQTFDAGFLEAKQAKERYVSGSQFLPEGKAELELLLADMTSLRDTASNQVVKAYLDAEVTAIEMQLNIAKARVKLLRINLSEIDCAELDEGLGLLKSAERNGKEAVELIENFQRNYPRETGTALLEVEPVSSRVLQVENNIVYVNNLKQLVC